MVTASGMPEADSRRGYFSPVISRGSYRAQGTFTFLEPGAVGGAADGVDVYDVAVAADSVDVYGVAVAADSGDAYGVAGSLGIVAVGVELTMWPSFGVNWMW